jgi:hypothetical protein
MSPNARNPCLLVKASAGIASALRHRQFATPIGSGGTRSHHFRLARGRHPCGQLSASVQGAAGAIVGRGLPARMRASDRKGGSSRGAIGLEPPVMTLMHATLLRKKYKGVSYGAISKGRPLHPSDILPPLWTARALSDQACCGLRSRPRGPPYTARKHNSAGPFSDSKGWKPPFLCSQDLACRPRQFYRICFQSLC